MLQQVKKIRQPWTVVMMVVCCIFLLSQCMDRETKGEANTVKPVPFAGSSSCAGCHKDVYESHLRTAHFLTSRPPEDQFILGSAAPDSNRYFFNQSVYVSMEKTDSGWYQVEYFRTEEKKRRRMDIVVGSGAMGQSFLNWRNNGLFQLPITYFSAAHQWSNSPGFPDKVVFNRTITSRCLECHTTYAQVISEEGKEPEQFNRDGIVYGVDCEKCHGPATEHVSFHNAHPSDKVARYIVNPARLSRQQNLDLCALCHGGRLQKTQPSFSFQVGDTLSQYFKLDTSAPDPSRIDVHGNQYGLLRASKCFRNSPTLTCNSCHGAHKKERGNTALYSQRCMTCHQPGQPRFCPQFEKAGKVITKNCIDCHMPLQPSRAIAVYLPGATEPTAAMIRSHYISIYPGETQKILAALKGKK